MNKPKQLTESAEKMRSEYDFRNGIRGKHAKAMRAGYTITIHHEDGTTTMQQIEPRKGTVVLEPDVQAYFPDSASVNHALRTLITLFPTQHADPSVSTQL